MTERLWSEETSGRAEAGSDDAGRSRPAGDAGGRPDRQLTLLEGGGRPPEWWLSQRTRVVGKRGVADARAVLASASRGRPDDADFGDTQRRAG
jgi:hypothetical protein